MIELLSADAMRRVEKERCESWGMETLLLMENAGAKIAQEIERIIAHLKVHKVFVVCGVGNNGGDGLVVARQLRSQFASLTIVVYLVGERKKMTKDTSFNWAVVRSLDIELREVYREDDLYLDKDALVVDALFGTGLKKPPEGIYAQVIERINQSGAFVVAIDVPSGVDATCGQVLGRAVRANLTVTLGKVKQGLVQFPAREYVGCLKLVDIGIPLFGCFSSHLLEPEDVRKFLPRRTWDAHKISAGVVGIIAGSGAMLGAGILATWGSYAVGAGMVVWPLPEDLALLVKGAVPEMVNIVLPRRSVLDGWHYSFADFKSIQEGIQARKCQSLVIGPGLGMHRGTGFFVERLLESVPQRGVLDADALNVVATNRVYWKSKLSGWVCTPHAGEMARLLGTSLEEVNQDRVSACQEGARYFGSITVLKGAATVIASPQGEVVINPTGGPILATAGSGDVLSGIIAGFMAQGLGGWESALCGVFLHGLAGDLWGREGKKSIIARDIVEKLPEARRMVENGEYTIPFLVRDPC